MSKRVQYNKCSVRVKDRKANQLNRDGEYYFKYNDTSAAGVSYTNFTKERNLVVPKPQFSLGLWDRIVNIISKVRGIC